MRVNIFQIPVSELEGLKAKLAASRMEAIKTVRSDGWTGTFYFSTQPLPTPVSWATPLQDFFAGVETPMNLNHFAAFIFSQSDKCYAISYGKAHFYIRPFCNYDFGMEIAKRIANEADIRQTASRRFQGRRKKDIRSFAYNTRLEVESGESVDYIQAAVISVYQEAFGKKGKFGTSVELSPAISADKLGTFLSGIDVELAKPARFTLPRTTLITDAAEVQRYDNLLLDELLCGGGTSDFVHNSYDLYGVDFVFTGDGTYTLSCSGYSSQETDNLDIETLKRYIAEQQIAREDVLRIKVRHQPEGASAYAQRLKEALDFIADDDRVLLTNGRWMHFNQDYLDFLDEFLREIEVEPTEPQFREITNTEPDFNCLDAIRDAGYSVADTDYSIFKTRASTPIEAWDLHRGSRVYAVKFGTAQKLGYVCDQAIAVLELLRNKAEVRKIPDFKSYCLWLGYKSKRPVTDITATGSIIFKQKIETWARKSRELGIEPILKMSHKTDGDSVT